MTNLKKEMAQLVRRAEHLVKESTNADTVHYETCRRLADEYELWDSETRFPLWLSHVVQGAMVDSGFEC